MDLSMVENDIKNLEYQTLKLPYEVLNKKFRQTQKNIDREVMKIQASVKDLEKLLEKKSIGVLNEVKMEVEGGVESEKKEDEEKKMEVEDGLVEGKVGEGLIDGKVEGRVMDEKMMENENKLVEEKKVEEGNKEEVDEMKQLIKENSVKLGAFTKKLMASIKDEKAAAETCKSRLQQLSSCCEQLNQPETAEVALKSWKKNRLDKMLVEYFLRSGYYDTAVKLAKNSDIEDLTNMSSYILSRDVEAALDNRDTSKCLAWCADNKSKLRKIKSTLEMSLRQQEFVELVRQDKKMQAILYARKHFSTMEDPQYSEIQQCMGMLIFPLDSPFSPYKHLSDASRWDELKRLYRKETYRMCQLNEAPAICLCLQAGLSALKTPICFESTDKYTTESERPRKTDCPVCIPAFKTLATKLPFALFSHSRLICFGSGESMNEHNLPLMLPNGNSYGRNYLNEMADKNDGHVTCPRTNEVFAFKEAVKVFIM